MKDFKNHLIDEGFEFEDCDLNEIALFRRFLAALKKTIGRVVQKGATLFKKARPGQTVRMKFPLPSVLSESNNTGSQEENLLKLHYSTSCVFS